MMTSPSNGMAAAAMRHPPGPMPPRAAPVPSAPLQA
jgi:hypothetical protein